MELLKMNRVRVKICGITNIEDALAAVEAGADAIGLVFYAPSPRAVSVESAQHIIQALPPFVQKVGLFVNESAEQIKKTLLQVKLDLLQFHGDENETFCQQFQRAYIKAVRVQQAAQITAAMSNYPSAAGILLDAYVDGVPGGTGIAFDWTKIPLNKHKPLILAGGLKPDNIQQAIEQSQVYAVDVSGGVELSKGIKDVKKMQTFIQGVCCARIK
jgi:phosphoribosylanthranilate isomerase